MITLYRSTLVAFLTKEYDKPPITSIKEIGSTSYRLAVPRTGFLNDFFTNAANGTVENGLKKSNKIIRFSNLNRFIDKMVKNEEGASKTILYEDPVVVVFNEHYPCDIISVKKVGRNSNPINSGMMFKKDWPFTELLNFHLLIMKETGVLDRLLEPHMRIITRSCPNEVIIRPKMTKPNQIAANKIFFLYVILLSGVILALVLFLLEKLFYKVTLT